MLLCDYDAPEKKRMPVGGGKVAGLEAKIVALEARIADLTSEKEARQDDTTSAELFSFHDATQLLASASSYNAVQDHFAQPPADAFSPRPRPPAASVPHLQERYDSLPPPPPREYGDIQQHKYFVQSHVAHRPSVPLLTPFTLPEPSPLLSLFYPCVSTRFEWGELRLTPSFRAVVGRPRFHRLPSSFASSRSSSPSLTSSRA